MIYDPIAEVKRQKSWKQREAVMNKLFAGKPQDKAEMQRRAVLMTDLREAGVWPPPNK